MVIVYVLCMCYGKRSSSRRCIVLIARKKKAQARHPFIYNYPYSVGRRFYFRPATFDLLFLAVGNSNNAKISLFLYSISK